MSNLNKWLKWVAISFFCALLPVTFYCLTPDFAENSRGIKPKTLSELRQAKIPKERRKKGRNEHYFRLLRDPQTNSIPEKIREKEVEFAQQLPTREEIAKRRPDQLTNQLTWAEAGPNDVGGRTRALGIDPRNTSIVLAGGVNGGMWRSVDKGASWDPTTDLSQNLSVVSLAQDPVNKNTWYYCMGEYLGSDSDRGSTAFFFGSGLFKSTDNGQTWTFLQFASTKFPVQWDSDFHYTTAVAVSPLNSNVFVGAIGGGLLRSSNGGQSFSPILGNVVDDHEFVEFDIASTGRLVAALSAGGNATPESSPGVYISDANGNSGTKISPIDFPSDVGRTLVKFAPSNPNIVYALANAGSITDDRDSVLFYKFTFSNGSWSSENRSANLPTFGGQAGDMLTQGNYNMVLSIKPDDPEFVVVGFTNLYRSKNGFSTKAASKTENWIGGYTNEDDSYALYEAHHPDQHAFVFDPVNPLHAWSGHDGGLSFTTNISASPVVWTSKNNGYNVTQFYSVAISQTAGNNEFLGGTQDNGTPAFEFDGTTTTASVDISSGDGSYAHYGSRYIYVSTQNGWVDQYDTQTENWAFNMGPRNASNMLFIHPYAVNPNNDAEMVYPEGRAVWVNSTLNLSNKQSGWAKTSISGTGINTSTTFSSLAYSNQSPSNVVYIGAYNENAAPRLVVFNPQTKTSVVKAITGAASGSYPHSISVNPANGNEILVVVSNYKVQSIFHSTNAGDSFSGVEGNLAGTTENPGPSVRSALIMKRPENVTEYYVGTSVGLYSTLTLSGSTTVWMREADDALGTAIVEMIAGRSSDGKIAAATHGRGIFTGYSGTASSTEDQTKTPPFRLYSNFPNPFNPSTVISFSLPQSGNVVLEVFDLNGRKIAEPFNGTASAGLQQVNFEAGKLSSGVYMYRLTSPQGVLTRKMTLVKETKQARTGLTTVRALF